MLLNVFVQSVLAFNHNVVRYIRTIPERAKRINYLDIPCYFPSVNNKRDDVALLIFGIANHFCTPVVIVIINCTNLFITIYIFTLFI